MKLTVIIILHGKNHIHGMDSLPEKCSILIWIFIRSYFQPCFPSYTSWLIGWSQLGELGEAWCNMMSGIELKYLCRLYKQLKFFLVRWTTIEFAATQRLIKHVAGTSFPDYRKKDIMCMYARGFERVHEYLRLLIICAEFSNKSLLKKLRRQSHIELRMRGEWSLHT